MIGVICVIVVILIIVVAISYKWYLKSKEKRKIVKMWTMAYPQTTVVRWVLLYIFFHKKDGFQILNTDLYSVINLYEATILGSLILSWFLTFCFYHFVSILTLLNTDQSNRILSKRSHTVHSTPWNKKKC